MAKDEMGPLDIVAVILLIIGGLNWGLVGMFGFDFVKWLCSFLGSGQQLGASVIYVVVGIAALYSIYSFVRELLDR